MAADVNNDGARAPGGELMEAAEIVQCYVLPPGYRRCTRLTTGWQMT
jgi:hypothetical protein